ncbi:hypothetical protein MJ579_23695 [Klebsiella pneumoniae]|nr:hypothetical protein MJ579_23695 [Klebsiella pneumoniae]
MTVYDGGWPGGERISDRWDFCRQYASTAPGGWLADGLVYNKRAVWYALSPIALVGTCRSPVSMAAATSVFIGLMFIVLVPPF